MYLNSITRSSGSKSDKLEQDSLATVKLGDDEFLRSKNAHMTTVHPVEYIQKNVRG